MYELKSALLLLTKTIESLKNEINFRVLNCYYFIVPYD